MKNLEERFEEYIEEYNERGRMMVGLHTNEEIQRSTDALKSMIINGALYCNTTREMFIKKLSLYCVRLGPALIIVNPKFSSKNR